MNKLVKILEAIGQSDSIHQNNELMNALSEAQVQQLMTQDHELKCSHHPGDDDDD